MAQNEQSSRALSSRLYTYQPLPDEHTIRILILHAGEYDDPLSGLIETAHLIERNQASATPQAMCSADRSYEAISYVWGSNTMDHSIYLDEKVLQITANLSDALHQCRLLDQPRALWADSICIDQANLKEKGHQVALMGRIYSCSQRTLICLGSDPVHRNDAQEAFSVLIEANEMIERTFQNADFTWATGSFPWPDTDDLLVNDPRWQSVLVMTELDWFERGWVVQEVALGREAFILWTGFTFPWPVLSRVYAWYTSRVRQMADKPDSVVWYLPPMFDQMYAHQRRLEVQTFYLHTIENIDGGILSVLEAARNLKLGDPRDRIYAFMALPFLQNPVPALEPDYEQSHLYTYQAFALKYLDLTKSLNILLCVQHDEQISNDKQENSWIPHWDRGVVHPFPNSLDKAKGFGDSDTDSCKFIITEEKAGTSPCLQVQAVLFDSVMFASSRLDEISTVEDVAALWQQIKKHYSIDSGQDQCNTTLYGPEFVATLHNGYWYEASKEKWGMLLNAYAKTIDIGVAEEPGNAESLILPADIQFCHREMLLMTRKSKICLLSRGCFGLGPWVVEEGDICAFVFGVGRPLILRRVPGEPAHHYKVVGRACVVSKQLDEYGVPLEFIDLDAWNDWDELCETEGLKPLNLQVVDAILH